MATLVLINRVSISVGIIPRFFAQVIGFPGVRNGNSRKLQQIVTDFDQSHGSVQSAGPYVQPIGPGYGQQTQIGQRPQLEHGEYTQPTGRERALTATGTTTWDQKEHLLGGRSSNPNLHHLYDKNNNGQDIPNVPSIPPQYLQNQAPRMGAGTPMNVQTQQPGRGSQGHSQNTSADGYANTPVDVPTLIATKGYNPVDFDTRPLFVSFFTPFHNLPFHG